MIDIENFSVEDLDETVNNDKPNDSVIIRHTTNVNQMADLRERFDMSSIEGDRHQTNFNSNEKPMHILTNSQDMMSTSPEYL